MEGKMRAVTVTVIHAKNNNSKNYICQVFPSFNWLILLSDNCKESKKTVVKIKNAAKWAYKNNVTKVTINTQ